MIWQDASHVGNVCQQLELHNQEGHSDIDSRCNKRTDALKYLEDGEENYPVTVALTDQDGPNHEQKSGNNTSHNLHDDASLKITDWEEEVEVTYRVDESPPFGFCILLGFQVEF